MVYTTQAEVEAWTGFGYTSFTKGGAVMTSGEWTTLVESLIAAATALINGYCRVTTLEEDTYTQYFDGRGRTGRSGGYSERDRTFNLMHWPLSSITSVHEDLNSPTAIPAWTTRTVRSDVAAGDYVVVYRGQIARIRFHNNIPRYGQSNLKVVYVAGYAGDSGELDEIGQLCNELIGNFLVLKKKLQEIEAGRTMGTPDAVDTVNLQEPRVFTPDLKARLKKYQRKAIPGKAWR
jgi:hypothetical protein